ncbi:MAG: isoprenylcysteine carboxylmethyltransferase family protein [Promethearchaeota archaeon]|nr:MAG: isoprenylcysteine carboxylmethyltransferase family protein [Candidatus Lokiarchaeota archaeon]
MNDISTILGIINFSVLLLSYLLFGYFYVLSIQPVKRQEKYGEKAWDNCKRLRLIASFFEGIVILNLILWIWFPLPIVDTWIISPNFWLGIIIALIIGIPCCIVMFLGLKAAGSESLTPSKDTKMYEGIYRYIRHPQTLGEFPLFVVICFGVNSWFLVMISTLFIVIYVPIMIYYEERDLIRRFGEKYRNYQKTTGALFPRLRKTS